MPVQNVKETISVPVSFFLEGLKDLSTELKTELVQAAAQDAREKGLSEDVRAELAAKLPEKMHNELAALGVALPFDMVGLTMTLGEFLFVIYMQRVQPMQAPLAIRRHEKRLQELAELFSKDEFDVPADVLEAIAPTLEDAELWASTQFSALMVAGGQPRAFALSAQGAAMFSKVLDAAVSLY